MEEPNPETVPKISATKANRWKPKEYLSNTFYRRGKTFFSSGGGTTINNFGDIAIDPIVYDPSGNLLSLVIKYIFTLDFRPKKSSFCSFPTDATTIFSTFGKFFKLFLTAICQSS